MEEQLASELARAREEIESLRKRLSALEDGSRGQNLPQTAILADSFLKRAFAVFGHNFVASLLVAIPIYILMFIVFLAVGMGNLF
ncbi:MAG TPA: hypothetical protein VF190_02900 [Rhodothermales bacterium]